MIVEVRTFRRIDYPHGCRCACCRQEFADGDEIAYREIGGQWVTPCCVECGDEAPLASDHPLLRTGLVLRADGIVASSTP